MKSLIFPSSDNMAASLVKKYGMNKGDVLLDVGCGGGKLLYAFNKLDMNVCGVDRKNEVKDVEFHHVADFQTDKLPFPDETFDIVFSKSVIEHLYYPENLMRESMRVLKKGGRIVLLTPDWQTSIYTFFNEYDHVHPYTKESVKHLLTIHGFQTVETEYFYQIPLYAEYPFLKFIPTMLRLLPPPKTPSKIPLIRSTRGCFVLGSGIK